MTKNEKRAIEILQKVYKWFENVTYYQDATDKWALYFDGDPEELQAEIGVTILDLQKDN